MANEDDKHYIVVLNMTWFFNRELFMSALGDIKLSKPISLRKMGFILGFFIVWTLPILLIFGINLSLPYLVLLFVPPVVLGNYASKPVWGGKTLLGFIKTLYKYLQEPRGWGDLRPLKNPDEEILYVESEIWVSRRRELEKMFRGSQR